MQNFFYFKEAYNERVGDKLIIVLVCFVNLFFSSQASVANTVYALPSHLGYEVKSYEILELTDIGQINYVEKYEELEYPACADIAIDSNSQFLAITFENEAVIQLISSCCGKPEI